MIDTWATVGSCAQIGKGVHLSGGVGIGGVLEPPQAAPVIVEDGAFIGSRCIVVEGVRVEREAVLGAGVVLTASTPIVDVRGRRAGAHQGSRSRARRRDSGHAAQAVSRGRVRDALRADRRDAQRIDRSQDLAQRRAARTRARRMNPRARPRSRASLIREIVALRRSSEFDRPRLGRTDALAEAARTFEAAMRARRRKHGVKYTPNAGDPALARSDRAPLRLSEDGSRARTSA